MSDHLPVTLELQTSANLLINKTFTKSSDFEFISGNVVSNTLSIKSNTLNSNLMLFIFNSLGQRIQTIAMSTSILHHDVSYLPNGVYYVLSNTNVNPIKFIKK
jgi:hypothetical protein